MCAARTLTTDNLIDENKTTFCTKHDNLNVTMGAYHARIMAHSSLIAKFQTVNTSKQLTPVSTSFIK